MTWFWIIMCHMVGDYLLQPNWMAELKTQVWWPAVIHGIVYTLPYLLLTTNVWALLMISVTHMVIDRYRLVKYIIWLKNQIGPRQARYKFSEADGTGYSKYHPPQWMSVWLMIITDNTLHLIINGLAFVLFVL
jgi:hypothetical protein